MSRRLSVRCSLVGILTGLAALVLFTGAMSRGQGAPTLPVKDFKGVPSFKVVRVIDGDTFIAEVEIDGRWREETIRMIGIDTPETSYSYGNEPECYGDDQLPFAGVAFGGAF